MGAVYVHLSVLFPQETRWYLKELYSYFLEIYVGLLIVRFSLPRDSYANTIYAMAGVCPSVHPSHAGVVSQEVQLSPRDRATLCQLKSCAVRRTQTDGMSAEGALYATTTFYRVRA